MQCTSPFTALTRGRHHCRFCGGFSAEHVVKEGACCLSSSGRGIHRWSAMPAMTGWILCRVFLLTALAKHDAMDWTCTRGWLNLPVGFSMEQEIYKATNTLRSYSQVSRLNPETSIHLAVLKGAKGLAILTVTKQVENSGCFIPEISEKNEVLRPKQVAQSTQKSLKQSWSRRRRFISFFFFFFFFFFRHCAQVTFRHERIASFENQGLHHWQQARAHTAVIYAAWAELKPIFFEGWMANDIAPGGQLAATSDVKNFPGFPEGILGMELMDRCWSQSVRFSTQIFTETVSKVDFSSTPFKVYTISKTVQADAVIVAITNRLVFPGSGEGKGGFWNRGISACAICDGAAPIFRNKPPLGGDPRR
ncbi:putative thioredoxin-disulfide reductase [Rosa chinensis]|uniref:Putative thioredoxin-disulfide reductase n=1 Tax=Rosa chinensis TaxID=74649 RepID=A0A2P6RKZ9_ROSCH|nr:putative thioredoxin-disulfide reductase [Rosa chinensis]